MFGLPTRVVVSLCPRGRSNWGEELKAMITWRLLPVNGINCSLELWTISDGSTHPLREP